MLHEKTMARLGHAQARMGMSRARARVITARAVAQETIEAYKYRNLTKQGNMTSVVVQHTNQGATIDISLEGYELDHDTPSPYLHWGMYRASGNQWYHPRETVPPQSNLDTSSGGMRSPLAWAPDRRAWTAKLNVPAKLLPLHLAMVFYYPDRRVYETPARSKYFSIPVGMSAGTPATLGATVVSVTPNGNRPEESTCIVNFAVFSRHATGMYLSLVRVAPQTPGTSELQGTGILEIALDPVTNRTGDVWHICVHGLRNIGLMCYGWRADGDVTWETGGRFHPGFILCDPYAARSVPVLLPEVAFTAAPKLLPSYDAKQPVNMASLSCFTQSFEWGGLHRPVDKDKKPIIRSMEEAIILEIDIEKFTQGPDAERYVARERRGKFLGILDRMREITEAGVTAVVLSPSCYCIPGSGPWSRSPISLFAPSPKYAQHGPLSAASELKMVIQALHGAGVDVLLSVEYNITGEGSDAMTGGLQGMRGLDAQVYYRALADQTTVLATGHPVVRWMVVDSLKHWATEYALDGFVFVNAENLVQDRHGTVVDAPPVVEDICQDPVLRSLKLIAAPSSQTLLPREGIRGFPHFGAWQQVNDRFMGDMWSYVVDNSPGTLSQVATRLTGSADLFGPQWDGTPPLPGTLAAGRRAAFGINNLTPIGDKPLLQALGSDQDLERAEVLARTLLLAQFTSAGTPMVSASTLSRKGLWRFVSILSSLRKQLLPLLNPPLTFNPVTPDMPAPVRDLKWHGAAPGSDVDWQGTLAGVPPHNVIAFSIREMSGGGSAVYVAINPHPIPVQVALPGPGSGSWRLVVDTSRLPPNDIDLDGPVLDPGQFLFDVGPKAGIMLVAVGPNVPRRASPSPSPQPPPPPAPMPGRSPQAPRAGSPVGRGGNWTPPMPVGGVPTMPSRF